MVHSAQEPTITITGSHVYQADVQKLNAGLTVFSKVNIAVDFKRGDVAEDDGMDVKLGGNLRPQENEIKLSKAMKLQLKEESKKKPRE